MIRVRSGTVVFTDGGVQTHLTPLSAMALTDSCSALFIRILINIYTTNLLDHRCGSNVSMRAPKCSAARESETQHMI